MNHISVIGNLTRDPEMKEVSGASCLNFTIAADTRNKGADGKPTTNYYTCTAWRQAAETLSKYVHKGDKLYVDGDLIIRQYKDNNGNDRTAVCINIQNFEFLSSRNAGGNQQQSAPANYSAPAQRQQNYAPRQSQQYTPVDDTLPF